MLILKKILLVLLSIIVTILCLECILRATYPFYKNYNTETWRYASLLKRISKDKELGHEHIPNKEYTIYNVKIKTNNFGFRSETDISTAKSPNEKRILLLGDSITMGWGVNYNDSYAKKLENLLNNESDKKYTIINTAVGNYGSKNILAALKKNICFDPDYIIYGFYINDIERVKYPSEWVFFLERNSYLWGFIMDKIINISYRGNLNYRNYYLQKYASHEASNSLKHDIQEMITIAKQKKIPFIFVNIPELHNVNNYPFKIINKFIAEDVLNNSDITYIDILPKLINLKNNSMDLWVTKEDPHPNETVHSIIAKEIYSQYFQKE